VRVYGNRFAVASLKFVVVDDAYASWREWTSRVSTCGLSRL
jgi:hypothetical protein